MEVEKRLTRTIIPPEEGRDPWSSNGLQFGGGTDDDIFVREDLVAVVPEAVIININIAHTQSISFASQLSFPRPSEDTSSSIRVGGKGGARNNPISLIRIIQPHQQGDIVPPPLLEGERSAGE